jgi:hypothetical protein
MKISRFGVINDVIPNLREMKTHMYSVVGIVHDKVPNHVKRFSMTTITMRVSAQMQEP